MTKDRGFLKKFFDDKKDEHTIEIEVEKVEEIMLPQLTDNLDMAMQYKQIMCFYQSGVDQLTVKLQILRNEFQAGYDRNPIKEISSRIKSPESILGKLKRKNLPCSMSCMINHIRDIAGVRVTCPLISDVYHVAKMLENQSDIEIIEIKDYITNPKKNGYRSLHLIVMVDVHFSEQMRRVPVEIQIRTIAMDFWASTEHQLRYKKDREFTKEMEAELKTCADLMADADIRMQKLAGSLGVE